MRAARRGGDKEKKDDRDTASERRRRGTDTERKRWAGRKVKGKR
jgi:hypothetical protein